MVPWSLMDTRAAWGSVELDIAMNQAHLPVPIICVELGGGQSWGYYNNQRNSNRLSCCCCCGCVSNCRMGPGAIMTFTVTRFFRVAREPGVYPCISSPMGSEYGFVNIESAAFPGCVCPISIRRNGNSGLFPKYASRGSSSKDAVSIASILSTAFNGFGSKTRQGIPARSNQFIREVQLLSYWCIRIWRSMGVLTDFKSGMSKKFVDAIVANMYQPRFGAR
jgi:hypothetical protein